MLLLLNKIVAHFLFQCLCLVVISIVTHTKYPDTEMFLQMILIGGILALQILNFTRLIKVLPPKNVR